MTLHVHNTDLEPKSTVVHIHLMEDRLSRTELLRSHQI